MRALVYAGTGRLEMREVEELAPAAGQSLIDVALCGICGSDMHAYHGHDSRRVPPLVLGHEAVGIVRGGAMEGRRVAINPLMTCGTCPMCTTGNEHLCPDRALIGMKVPGAFAERVVIDDINLTELPEDMPFSQAVLAEPLACTVHAVAIGLNRFPGPASSARVAVLGGGAIGLLSALVLQARGVSDLWIAETNALRRGMLESVLRAKAYDPIAGGPEPGSMQIVIDAVGSGRTRQAAAELCAPGGTIVHIGLQDSEPGLDTRRLTLQEIAFIGTYAYTPLDFAEALRLLRTGQVSAEGWTETRPLDDGARSFADIDDGNAPPKIVLTLDGG